MKKQKQILNSFFVILFLFTSACSSIPKNTANSCSIFSEKYFWYKHVKKTEKKWGTPVHLQLAFIKMESDFDWLAKPQRLKLFKVIPYKRPSSSFGYSQAVKGTWEQYKKEIISLWLPELDLRTALTLLGGIQIKVHKY